MGAEKICLLTSRFVLAADVSRSRAAAASFRTQAYSMEAMMLIDANVSVGTSPRHRRRTASVSCKSAMAAVCKPCV